ncbi:MAG TPA: glycoside hydrolase family 2 protein, partial [Candidatus Bathyarchaeia archaeon]|nr:glycoside hydrolase family 2 protein [Candidatus Bathyarchaeia archaeon]
MHRLILVAVLALALLESSCNEVPSRSTIVLDRGWEFRRVSEGTWRRATVPGCVHTDLYDRGLIPDPFYGDNERALQWIENEDWEYRTTFDADADFLSRERIEIDFAGLDTYADVYLNDSLIIRADNMFREWRSSCKGLLRDKGNELRVYFHSPVEAVRARWQSLGRELPGGPRVLTRKAAYQYGWDWSPRYVTSGIWRPVRLVAWDQARIKNLWIVQHQLTSERADLAASFEIESTARQTVTMSIYIGNESYKVFDVDLLPGSNDVSLDFSIPRPELWWANGLGEPRLYDFLGEMRAGGVLLDWTSRQFGIRTIDLVREKDAAGTSFYFRLNGVPVFMKGANYVPQDCFPSRLSGERHEFLVASAANAGMNMLRVWGGGVYEDDDFYSLCDKYGILVWQDFMFACGMYPADSLFLDNVREEASENVTRLRSHPCLALWCGNNEIDEGWHHWGWQGEFGYSAVDSARVWGDYVKLFHELLPAVVEKYDPGAAYLPSSPVHGRADPRSLTEGDSHYWGVWHDGEPFEAYTRNIPQFMSEFGFQSFPPLAAIESFARPEDWRVDSPVMLAHQKNPRGNEIITTYLERSYRTPRDFASFVYVSELLQAEGMKTGIEAHRRAKPYCMGSLYWQLNDCWPAVSWSSIDYYGNPKALYYYARR